MRSPHLSLALAALALAAACSTTTATTSGTTGPPGTADARHRTTTTVPAPGTTSPGGPVLPRADLTPGKAADPASPNGTKDKLCAPGFSTKTVRPPEAVTEQIKRERMKAYGIPASQIRSLELDHLIPLSAGGDPTSDANLWPEPWEHDAQHPQGTAAPGTGAQSKDRIEVGLIKAICAGKIQLVDAQHRIATDWPHALDGIAGADEAAGNDEEN